MWLLAVLLLPSRQATYALLALAWVFVPVYISAGVRGAAVPPPSPPKTLRCADAALRSPRQGSQRSFPSADRHDARVPPAEVWRREDPHVPLGPVAPALHLHQDLCK